MMSEAECQALFVAELIERARALPLREAVGMLRGALLIGGEHEALEAVRGAYIQISTGDAQLELIASAQRKLWEVKE